jgi:diguanylate cyclase (GGDEF)-like protein/PAS domain S-box-containing protein
MADADRAVIEAKRLLRVQQAIAGHIAGAESRAELLQRVLGTIGSSLEWTFGAAWDLDPDGRLRCRATWQRPGAQLDEFEAETRERSLARWEGLPGRTWALGEPMWIPDAADENVLPFGRARRASARMGLASAVAFPVTAGERFDGVLEFFSAYIREPDADLLAMFAAVGSHLAQALERWDAIAALADSEELNRSVVSALAEGVMVLAADGRVLEANEAAAQILGVARDALVGRSPDELVDSGFEVLDETGVAVSADANAVLDAIRTGRPQRDIIVNVRRSDGSGAWLSVNLQPLQRTGDAEPHGVVCSLEDITERRRTVVALRDQRDRAQRYLDVTNTMIIVLDAKGRVELINPKCMEVLGRTAEQLKGRDWVDLAVPAHARERSRETIRRLMAGELEPVEFSESPVLTRDGRERVIAWRNAAVRDDSGRITGTISSGEDVTERRAAEQEIAHLAFHDHLTGLPNRTLLEEHLSIALARAARQGHSVALLFLDLDDFKLVNDNFGHVAGDQVLGEVASRLRSVTRASDLLARQGGDEFLLLLTDLGDDPEAVAGAVATKLTAALERPFALDGSSFHIGASIGISLFPRDAASADALMRHADAAMYRAKAAGRAAVVVYPAEPSPEPRVVAVDRPAEPVRLRHAIENDELVLHYQPVVRLRDGQIVAMEALVRWQDPDRGLIAPGEFIPQAEHTGLIGALGDWVLDAVLAQAGRWAGDGLRPGISFNLSPHQLRNPRLAGALRERLEETGVEPERVSVEITESAAIVEADGSALRELAAVGIRLAVDDFGMRASALGRLRTLPVDTIKIDRAFVSEIAGDREARAVLSSIVRTAEELGKVPIAGGVETRAQRRHLIELGCPLAQGFLLALPMTAAQATEHLREVGCAAA